MSATVLTVNSPRRGITAPRPVRDPTGTIYPSLTQAALAHNRHPGGLSVMVKLGRKGWRYASEAEIAAAPTVAE